jgi:hypothetical protein
VAQGFPEKLEVDGEHKFVKDGHRVYSVDIPMDLFSSDWKAVARVAILRTTVGDGKTVGVFKILMVYTPEQSKAVSSTIVPYDGHNKKE